MLVTSTWNSWVVHAVVALHGGMSRYRAGSLCMLLSDHPCHAAYAHTRFRVITQARVIHWCLSKRISTHA